MKSLVNESGKMERKKRFWDECVTPERCWFPLVDESGEMDFEGWRLGDGWWCLR